ncbi:hypothetical protein WUBG_14813 [Wuchereria bancrofti]|uniref:Uncharacterized protein n=1 Tax=Wuchereria bancrofti TaxID=6293 RepID=J9EB78_WUCBA|nr:hypothetical protein WUBG_14813 [Wuchereria bancrofti]
MDVFVPNNDDNNDFDDDDDFNDDNNNNNDSGDGDDNDMSRTAPLSTCFHGDESLKGRLVNSAQKVLDGTGPAWHDIIAAEPRFLCMAFGRAPSRGMSLMLLIQLCSCPP